MAQPTISMSGLSTNLDWQSWIEKLMAVEKAPVTGLENRVADETQRKSVYSSFSSGLATLDSAVVQLRYLEGNVLSKVSALSSNSTVASAIANASAQAATSTIQVYSLATSARAVSSAALYTGEDSVDQPAQALSGQDIRQNAFDANASLATQDSALKVSVGSGGTISVNGSSFDWTSSDSLNDVLGRINSAGLGVTATYDNSSGTVRFMTNTTGGTATMTLDQTSGSLFEGMMIETGARFGTSAQSFNPNIPMGDAANRLDSQINSGNFTINGVTFYFPPSTMSLTAAIESINKSTAGVMMSYDASSGKLSVQSTETGSSAGIVFGAAGDTSNFLEVLKLGGVTPGTNGSVSVDGGAAQSISSNKVSGLVSGAVVSLKSVGTTTISVGNNADSAVDAMKTLVDKANTLLKYAFARTTEKTVDSPTTSEERLIGTFNGDGIFSDTMDRIYATFNETRLDEGVFKELSQVGLTLVSEGIGTAQILGFDEAAFRSALASNPQDVQKLIGEPTTGLADKLHALIQTATSYATGPMMLEQVASDAIITDLNEQITTMKERLDVTETNLRTQFSQMESMISSLRERGSTFAALIGQYTSSTS
jgi:flagellar hook-associated protein 2